MQVQVDMDYISWAFRENCIAGVSFFLSVVSCVEAAGLDDTTSPRDHSCSQHVVRNIKKHISSTSHLYLDTRHVMIYFAHLIC